MKTLRQWVNDMDDIRHLNRLFAKYEEQKYNFEGVYQSIKDKIPYCSCPEKLQEYYNDMRYLKSVEATWAKRLQAKEQRCKELREAIRCL